MILLDTNVVIDMINNSQDAHWELLNKEDVVVCGIVIAELYRGIKNAAEKNAVELFVNAVDELPLEAPMKEPLPLGYTRPGVADDVLPADGS